MLSVLVLAALAHIVRKKGTALAGVRHVFGLSFAFKRLKQ